MHNKKIEKICFSVDFYPNLLKQLETERSRVINNKRGVRTKTAHLKKITLIERNEKHLSETFFPSDRRTNLLALLQHLLDVL